ncbi:aldose epimerase [Euhalothece natronophila Z-M001]|uniref:Aldose epimerase n=1 Tax=Euhalothece natronophila Z-M001 TaxID=522448 RepID=A0A5B8NLL2_9CHRO|nr:aldose epimerase [Euhalothece natronophila]QDZ39421.1 aldose epimerase [Euhalothece natronophila Z-M001]
MSYAIARRQEESYQTYILSDEAKQSRLEIVPQRGGIVTSWRIQGQEIFYMDWDRFQDANKSVRGGIPILFPICGDLPNDCYTYQGQEYTLKRHGFARDLPWEVTAQETENEAALTLVLKSNDQTRAIYPFDFEITFTYRLKGNTLTLDQTYRNYSSEAMPFSTGLHPYFWLTDKEQMQLDIPATQYQDNVNQGTYSYQGKFNLDQEEIDAQLRPLARQKASIALPKRGFNVNLSFSPEYTTVVFWNIKGKDFTCLEPWTAPRNAMNTGEDLLVIPSWESKNLQVVFEITPNSN